jgi:WD40 repeat protein
LVSCGDDNKIKFWNIEKGEIIATLEGHTDAVRCIAFSPDGKYVASGAND